MFGLLRIFEILLKAVQLSINKCCAELFAYSLCIYIFFYLSYAFMLMQHFPFLQRWLNRQSHVCLLSSHSRLKLRHVKSHLASTTQRKLVQFPKGENANSRNVKLWF